MVWTNWIFLHGGEMEPQPKKSFFSSIPGIITTITATVAALAGLASTVHTELPKFLSNPSTPVPTQKKTDDLAGEYVLQFGDGQTTMRHPDTTSIGLAIQSLSQNGKTFVIVGRNDSTYMQTYRFGPNKYILEYQDGSVDQHFEVRELEKDEATELSEDQVTSAMQQYVNGDRTWREQFHWVKMQLK
jgi:hypothetical protein